MKRPCGILLVLCALVAADVGSAVDVPLPAPGNDAWRSLEFPQVAKHTLYEVAQSDGAPAFKAQADCSASAMYVPARSIDLTATPVLRWRWKLEKGIDVAEEKTKAGDDFAARVYVMFDFDSENASWWARATQALGQQLYGDIVPGNTINYVWSSRAAVGASWKSPYTDASQIIVKRAGEAQGWVESEANIAADYRTSFGGGPTALRSVALMSDTDNTCQKSVASFADFRFTAIGEP